MQRNNSIRCFQLLILQIKTSVILQTTENKKFLDDEFWMIKIEMTKRRYFWNTLYENARACNSDTCTFTDENTCSRSNQPRWDEISRINREDRLRIFTKNWHSTIRKTWREPRRFYPSTFARKERDVIGHFMKIYRSLLWRLLR